MFDELKECHLYCSFVMNMYMVIVVVVDYNNIYIVHYYYYYMLVMNDNTMLMDHMDILLKNYNNNYLCRMIGMVEDDNNIEVEDDMLDNTYETVE